MKRIIRVYSPIATGLSFMAFFYFHLIGLCFHVLHTIPEYRQWFDENKWELLGIAVVTFLLGILIAMGMRSVMTILANKGWL